MTMIHPNQRYIPTKEEIAERRIEICAGWSAAQELRARTCSGKLAEIPEMRTEDLTGHKELD